ncbi:MAG TPA: aminopeptidase [Candidatus Binataceae bacterium]|nr:aminopeptidase [Candidatus Binataceae bacterium]
MRTVRTQTLSYSARLALAVVAGATIIALAGCNAGYITHAAYEEMRILMRRKPITEELARAELPPTTRAKLETVLAVRKFAADQLELNVGGAYSTVAQVDNGAVVWVVMAAPRTSLAPYTWWFPVVGDVPYRGYFSHDDANAEAAQLEAQGYDTYVRPAIAFSSLGFFNDPLLSNLLQLSRVELAGVIIHELFHRTYFLMSDVMFDESAATWIGNRGAVDFFSRTEGPDSTDAVAATSMYDSDMKFAAFLLQEQARLLKLYSSGLPRDEILRRRVVLFAAINSDYAELKPTLSGLERFDLDKTKLNNAVLLNYLIYFHQLDDFAKLLSLNHDDLRTTIKQIIALAKSQPNDPFFAIWQATHKAASSAASSESTPSPISHAAGPLSGSDSRILSPVQP